MTKYWNLYKLNQISLKKLYAYDHDNIWYMYSDI